MPHTPRNRRFSAAEGHTFGASAGARPVPDHTLSMTSLFRSPWKVQGIKASKIVRLTWNSILQDRLLGRAAELAFYFLFAFFPTLFSASSILGMVARSASHFYDLLL